MVKVLLVDDEVLAMNYLSNLIDWEEQGFEIVGCARNGSKALEMYEKYHPEIVISDIKMVGMDGLELAMRLKKMCGDIVVILLSAYKDFEYAKKGIEYAVNNYLLKHELNEDSLIEELNKAKESLVHSLEKEKIYQNYFARQLIRGTKEKVSNLNLGNRFFLIMIQKNSVFREGNFYESSLEIEEGGILHNIIEEPLEDSISYVADTKLTQNHIVVLYKIINTVSKYSVNTVIERKAKQISRSLEKIKENKFNLLYSYEITQDEISDVFQKMSGRIRYSVYWKLGECYALSRISKAIEEEKQVWTEQIEDLQKAIYSGNEDFKNMIHYLFEQVTYPEQQLESLKEMLHLLEELLRTIEQKEGIYRPSEKEDIFKIDEIERYYIECYQEMFEKLYKKESQQYSTLVFQAIRYIRKNFSKDLNLDVMGEAFQMNGVYFGQVFKKETGSTFLKYLTSCRIEEAKILLESGEYTVAEVAEQVGYGTSQYFSQIFIKSTGMKPQEYKKWSERRKRSDT